MMRRLSMSGAVVTFMVSQSHAVTPIVSDSTSDSIFLKEVVKTATTRHLLKSTEISTVRLGREAIKNIPTMFGEADVIKALQLQPGVSAGVEGFAGMMVRGGNSDENLFLIDGTPIYQMNHLGGLFSAYNVEAINGVSFLKGAFPARYGGRLSSVVDISTLSGDFYNYSGSFTVGLTSANFNINGPIFRGKTSFAFSIRRSWLELVSVPAIAIVNASKKSTGEKIIAGYGFTDMNIKLDHRMGNLGVLSLTGYYGNDNLKMGKHNLSTDKEDAYYSKKDVNRLNWGNLMGALQWKLQLNDNWRLNTSLSYVKYHAALKRDVNTVWENSKDFSLKHTNNSINDYNASLSVIYSLDDMLSLRTGISYTHHKFLPEDVLIKSSDEDISQQSRLSKVDAAEATAYAEATVSVGPFDLNVGVRGVVYSVEDKDYAYAEPRAALNCQASDKVSIKAGYAWMTQTVQQVSDNYISLPTDYWIPISGDFKPLRSQQVSAGVYFQPNDKYYFSMEGYYKKMHSLLEYKAGHELLPIATPWQDRLTSGDGCSYGIDLYAVKSSGKVRGTISYGLLWSDRTFPELNNGKTFPSKYDNRHKFNVAINYSLSKKVELNATWTYMTGNRVTISLENYDYVNDLPTTMVPSKPIIIEDKLSYFEGRNNVRLPAYHRLDLGLNIYRPRKNGKMSIWNVSLYNAYSRMNPIMIEKNDDKQDMSGKKLMPRFRTLSLFPIIPSVSYTYKF